MMQFVLDETTEFAIWAIILSLASFRKVLLVLFFSVKPNDTNSVLVLVRIRLIFDIAPLHLIFFERGTMISCISKS